jgi:hypothetical protein
MVSKLVRWSFMTIFCMSLVGCQSGCGSRLGMGNASLKAPDDCVKIINMGKGSNVKYIVYLNNQGKIYMQEYSDWGVSEAKYELTGMKFDKNLNKITK